jgi:hypothetical protein
MRPPKCCLFGWMTRYFFFAAFFAVFFAGAFLAAFFVAILPILPFRWFASRSATFVAVEEMYRFIKSKCQAKNEDGVEKVATIFRATSSEFFITIKEDDENEEARASIQQQDRASYAQRFLRANFF